MDNVTHSLIGVALGHCVIRAVPRFSATPEKKKLILWTSILANNAPDIDVFLPFFMGGGRLTSLIEHRGYTHTFIAAPFLGGICLVVAWVLSGRPKITKRNAWLGLFALSVWSVFCHLGADFFNDYGVHPFSPFVNRWYYGDSLFILEPLIWFSILPLAFQESKVWVLKGLVLVLAVGMSGMLVFGAYVPAGVGFFALFWGALACLWQRVARGRRWNWVPSVVMCTLILISFVAASQRVRGEMSQLFSERVPMERIVQFVRTPSPANPLCWRILIVSENAEDRYAVREGVVSLVPKQLPPSSCLRRLESGHTVSMQSISLPDETPGGSGILWKGEYVGSRKELARLNSEFCQFRALREFARAPFWVNRAPGWAAGDLRYDRSSGRGFSGVRFGGSTEDTVCPGFLPGWDPPVPE